MSDSLSFDQDSESFLQWFNSLSATHFHSNLKFADFRGRCAGRGIIATADIAADTELFVIPRNAIICLETSDLAKNLPELFVSSNKDAVSKTEEIGKIDEENIFDHEPRKGSIPEVPESWLNLILILIYETLHQDTSKWSPYLSVLPQKQSQFDTLMFWTESELSELQASAAGSRIGRESANKMFIERIIPVVKQHATTFYPTSDRLSDEELLEKCHIMGSLIMSYAFDLQPDDDLNSNDEQDENEDGWVEDHSKPSTLGMVPMADMLNADAEFNAHLTHGEDSLTMTSLREIKAGEEVLNYYGPLPNSELLRRYGYTSTKHSRFDVVELTWSDLRIVLLDYFTEKEKDNAGLGKTTQLEKLLSQMENDEEDELPDSFILDREAGDPDEEGLHTTEAKFTKLPEELIEVVSSVLSNSMKDNIKKRKLDDENKSRLVKLETLNILKRLINRQYQRYTTSKKQNQELLEPGNNSQRLNMAISVRMGEQTLLEEALEWTEKMQVKYTESRQDMNGSKATGQPPKKRPKSGR